MFFNDLQQCCRVIITTLAFPPFFLSIYHLPVHPCIHSSLFFSRLSPASPRPHAVRIYSRKSHTNEPHSSRFTKTADVQKSPRNIVHERARTHFRDTRGFASRATASGTIDNASTSSLRSSHLCLRDYGASASEERQSHTSQVLKVMS